MAKILHKGNCDDGFMRGEGKFEVFQTKAQLMDQVMAIERAGRTCYRSQRGEITMHSAPKFLRMILRRGHESVIEHSCLTVRFSNVSRGFTHEMVRHRLAAYSQESTRYVDYAGGKLDMEKAELAFILPPHQNIGGGIGISVSEDLMFAVLQIAVNTYEQTYKMLREVGWPPQDARQFLPIGIASSIVVTANFREWRHIFKMRTQKAAHWEIRYMMCDLLAHLKGIIPELFEDFDLHEGNVDTDGYRYAIWLPDYNWP